MFHFNSTPIEGLFLIDLPDFKDDRGSFTKVFNEDAFKAARIDFSLRECYFSVSARDVVRGMHFQLPPYQHAKIVCCPHGAILDVVLDLRKNAGTYGRYYAAELSSANHQAFYIPEGMAHGFKSLEEGSITQYLVSSGYEKDADTGVLYNSFGFDWQVAAPLMSPRDLSFDGFANFNSPF